MAKLNTIITLRQGTTAEWASSIVVLKKGELGLEYLADGSVKIKAGDGEHLWSSLSYIGSDDTTYDFSFENEKITITPKIKGVAQQTSELDLSNFITSEELAEELGKLTDNDTTYSVAEGEKVLKLTDTVFSTEIGLKHENGKISLTGINGEVIAEFSDADFIKDSVLENVEYDSATQEIVFTWKTEGENTKTDRVSVADFVQTYTAGNGLEVNNNEFAIKVDSESEAFLSVDAKGIKLAGIQSAINSAANTAKEEAILDASNKYVTTGVFSNLETAIEGRLVALEGINHELFATKAELEPVATAVTEAETAIEDLETRLEEVVNIGAEPNLINKIQVNGIDQTITDKVVNIAVPALLSDFEEWAGFETKITNNEQEIKTLKETTIPGVLTEINTEKDRALAAEKGLDNRLATVETFFAAVETPDETIDTLAEIVKYIENDKSGAEGMLASIQANEKAIKAIYTPANGEAPAEGLLVSEIARVESLTTTNTQAIAAINHSETGILATAKKYTNDQIAAIPVAGALPGLVKSSEADNQIKVETDGTMSVNRINVDKLYVAEDDEFVLNGGSAI